MKIEIQWGERIDVQTVSASLLTLAGIPALKGRLFDEADLDAEGDRPIIISEQMWRKKLEADVRPAPGLRDVFGNGSSAFDPVTCITV